MPILPSAGKRIQELLRPLESAVAAERESAVARLTLLGPRTIPHIQEFLKEATTNGRLAALDVLERLGDARGLDSVLPLTIGTNEDVARRAIEIAAAFPEPRAARAFCAVLSSGSPSRRRAAAEGLGRLNRLGLVEAVEPLLGLVLDQGVEEALRLDALQSLSSLDRRALLPALKTLAKDRSPALVRAAAALTGRRSGVKGAELVSNEEAEGPALLARLASARISSAELSAILAGLAKRRTPALLPLLRRRLDDLSAEAAALGVEATARSKARIHLALGALGSRIALHDLREMLRARPVYAAHDLLAAADLVGDASLVPALAALAADEPRLVEVAAPVFRAIVRREKVRRTSRVVRGLDPRHTAALEALWEPQGASSGRSREARNRKAR
jgi:hypothetical protein